MSQLLGYVSTIITSNVYFDKNRVIINCVEELNEYLIKIKPEEKNNGPVIEILGMNFAIDKYIRKLLL